MTAGLPRSRVRAAARIPLDVSSRIRAPVVDGLSGEYMTSTANLASTTVDADHPAAPAAEAGPFVLNLCSSTTPMALAQTDLPELKRFTFFVSRRFEEGRERFRLHMGFFASQAEAEEWLGVVRDIYPGAWAGEAPGKKLRARAAEAAAAQARHAVGPQNTAKAPPPAAAPTPPAAPAARPQTRQPAPASQIPTLVPTLHPPAAAPAPTKASSPARGVSTPPVKAAPQQPAKRAQAAPAAPRAAAPAPATPRAPAQNPAAPRTAAAPRAATPPAAPAAVTAQARPAAAPTTAKSAPQSPTRVAQQPAKKAIFANSNVKEVM